MEELVALRSHPPSARNALPLKKTKLIGVSQVRDALRFGPGDGDAISEIVITECSPDTISGDLVWRVISMPPISASLRVLDLSFNGLPDQFWTSAAWGQAASHFRWPSLTAMSLASNRFSEASLPSLCSVLERCPVLKSLDLSINAFGYRLMGTAPNKDIGSLLSVLPKGLETLDLSCLHISDDYVRVLLSCGVSRSLRRLYLRSNDLTSDAAAQFAAAMSSGSLPSLRVLSLAGNAITDNGIASLAFAFDAASALETLDLDENDVTGEGLQTVFHVINGLEYRFSLRHLHLPVRSRSNRDHRQLVDAIQFKLQEKTLATSITSSESECLDLSGKHAKTKLLLASVLDDHFVCVALTAIRSSASTWLSLEVLDLSGNAISTPGAWAIGSFLAQLPPNLRVLNLSANLVNDEGIKGLADGVEWNATLRELNLNHNQITDDGAKQLYLKAFTSNLQRKILLNEGNTLTSECKVMVAAISRAYDLRKRFAKEFAPLAKLELVGQQLRQYSAAAVVECLISTPEVRCTALDLSSNQLGDEGATEVAKLLREFPQLTKLDVSFNDIGDNGAREIANALCVNTTLVSFSLHSSIPGSSIAKPKLTDAGLTAIAQAAEKHRALTSLDLRDNVMPAGLNLVLVQILQKNTRIVKFNGSSAAVFLSRNEP